MLNDQNPDGENQEPSAHLTEINEMKPLHLTERERIPWEKYQLEIEQRVKRIEDSR